MTDPRDEIDNWLQADVNLLSPPPGTLDRIRRRARRRRARQALLACAGCAVVVAGAVSVPHLIPAGQSGRPTAAGRPRAPLQPGPRRSAGKVAPQTSGSPTSLPTQLAERTHLSPTSSGTVPPPHFQPTSVTFVGTGSGGFVGAVLGQAGPPCATRDCTSLAGTSSYGSSWYGVSAPVAPGPGQSSGVSQLRFANLRDGWAFGPALYETTGGGWPWKRVPTGGQDVVALEASGQTALAVFATCPGLGPDFAAACTSFALYRGTAGGQTWTPVQVPPGYQHMTSTQPSSADLVIAGGTGYLLTPSGMLLSGPLSGPFRTAGQAPCAPQPPGQPSGAQLAVAAGHLVLSCAAPASGATRVVLYTSADGSAWQQSGVVPGASVPTSLSVTTSGHVLVATAHGIYYSAGSGAGWQLAGGTGTGTVPGGFDYVGMTSTELGVAVPVSARLGEVYVTRDGGATWAPSPIAS